MNTRSFLSRPTVIVAIFALGIVLGWGVRGCGGSAGPDGAGLATGTTEAGAAEVQEWTCSMHPQIRSHQPGLCPICAMDLIPVESGGDDEAGPVLTLSPTARKLASVQTAAVRRAPAAREVRLTGVLRADETREREISAWVGGRVEKLHVDFTGRAVRKGQPLLDLYSPELYAAQEELIQAMQARRDLGRGSDLLARNETAARERLRLWGLDPAQIDEIVRRGKAEAVVTIPAPISGIVLQKSVQVGQTVGMGAMLYQIADLSRLWLELEAYEADLPFVSVGDDVAFETDAFPGETFHGRVVFVDPMAQPETRTIRVRVEVPNESGRLKPAMYARAELYSRVPAEGGGDPLVIPATAPLLTGERAIVYVADPQEEGRFEGREVVLGPKAGEVYVVRAGLLEGERVVSRGAFQIDSALQIRARKSMMNPEGDPGAAMPGHDHGSVPIGAGSSGSGSSASVPGGSSGPGAGPGTGAGTGSAHGTGTGTAGGTAAGTGTGAGRMAVPDGFLRSLDPALDAYFALSEALSLDDAETAKGAAGRLADISSTIEGVGLTPQAHARWMALRPEVLRRSRELARADGLDAARVPFEPLSNALIALVREMGAAGPDSVWVYHCPMAFQNRGADWLQNRQGVENPYFGSKMYRCGSETERLVP